MIAHTVRKSIAGLISRADQLAYSVNFDAAPLGAASVDETLSAPVLREQTIPQAAAEAAAPVKPAQPTINLRVNAVERPAYNFLLSPAPTIAPSDAAVPSLPMRVISPSARASKPASPVMSAIAHSGTGQEIASAVGRNDELDNLAQTDVFGDFAGAPAQISAPSVSLRPVPAMHKPQQIASANVGIDNIPMVRNRALSDVDVARIKAQAAEQMPEIASGASHNYR